MTESRRRAAELRALLARLDHQREMLERVEERLDRAIPRAAGGEDPEAAAAVALYLQHYYTAVEDAFLRIAVELDGSSPSGDEWHRLLLQQLALAIPDVRPALLDEALADILDVLRRFRHRVRHAYDESYDWGKMTGPLEALSGARGRLPTFFSKTREVVMRIVRGLEGSGA